MQCGVLRGPDPQLPRLNTRSGAVPGERCIKPMMVGQRQETPMHQSLSSIAEGSVPHRYDLWRATSTLRDEESKMVSRPNLAWMEGKC